VKGIRMDFMSFLVVLPDAYRICLTAVINASLFVQEKITSTTQPDCRMPALIRRERERE
jgi:hypothetical protein